MRKGMVAFFMILCCGALLAGGCAKKEMVKGEEAITTTTAAEKAPVTVKEETVKAQPIKEETAAGKEAPAMDAAKAALEAELGKIYYDYDSFVLSEEARNTLFKGAELLLKKHPKVKVQIEGHCDERGSDEYNLALGEKRAKSALNYLLTLGVQPERLSFISYGKEKPADPGHDEAAWAKNRRAEFVIIK